MSEELDQVRRGWAILRGVTRPEWLRQPSPPEAFAIFRKHGTTELLWNYRVEKERLYPHRYDKRAARLGAASSVKVGVGAPEHARRPAFTDEAGLWHLQIESVPAMLSEGVLPPLFKGVDTWQYTPIVRLLLKLGCVFTIEEAYLFPEQHQALRPFYEHMKLLRQAACTPEELAETKLIYTKTFGSLAHLIENPGPSYVYRPDWYYTLVAHEKAILFMQMLDVWEQEGVMPQMVQTDCIWYNEPVSGLPIGPEIGQFKHNDEEPASKGARGQNRTGDTRVFSAMLYL